MICIYPKDTSTDFLFPFYEKLCSMGITGFHCDTNLNKDKVLYAIEKSEVIIFLGHGTSFSLMGTPINEERTNIIDKENVSLLCNKKLFLLSCRSAEFCESFGLNQSIGFGMMPTGVDDVFSMLNEDSNFPNLDQNDIDVYNKALVNALCLAFDLVSIDHLEELYNKFKFSVNIEITKCLLEKESPMYREVADLLQDLKNDCELMLR